jgi:hypothetical protein
MPIVSRSAYRNEQFPGRYGAGINGHAADHSRSIKPLRRRNAESFSNLKWCPPHGRLR